MKWKPSRDWYAVAPHPVASAQIGWERRQAIVRMRALGFTRKQVADAFDISTPRVDQLVISTRQSSRKTPPITEWAGETDDLQRLANAARRRRLKVPAGLLRPRAAHLIYDYPPWRRERDDPAPYDQPMWVCTRARANAPVPPGRKPIATYWFAEKSWGRGWVGAADGQPIDGPVLYWMDLPPIPEGIEDER